MEGLNENAESFSNNVDRIDEEKSLRDDSLADELHSHELTTGSQDTKKSNDSSRRNKDLIKENKNAIKDLTRYLKQKDVQDQMDKEEMNKRFNLIQEMLFNQLSSKHKSDSSESEESLGIASDDNEINRWAALMSKHGVRTEEKNPRRSSDKFKKNDSRNKVKSSRDSILYKTLRNHEKGMERASSKLTVQTDFTIKRFDQNNRFTFAAFRNLYSKLKAFMKGRSLTDSIGPATLISSEYFSEYYLNGIATRLRTLKKNYLANIKSKDSSIKRLMFEIPDFMIKEISIIDVDFLEGLHWGEALAWLEMYFKATDEMSFIKFYEAAADHITKNIVQAKYISIPSTNHIANDIRSAHLYYQKCLSVNPQRHSSSTEDKYVSVGAFPGLKDRSQTKTKGMLNIMLSYLPEHLEVDFRKQIIKEQSYIDTMEKVMIKIEDIMSVVDEAFQASESTFLAIAADQKDNNTWGKHKVSKSSDSSHKYDTTRSSSLSKSSSSVTPSKTATVKHHRMNNTDGDTTTVPTFADLSEMSGAQIKATNGTNDEPLDEQANPMHTDDTTDEVDFMSEYINTLVQDKLGPNEPSYCTRAMFANIKGTQKCDKPNCKYVHSEDGYKKIINVLAEFYSGNRV